MGCCVNSGDGRWQKIDRFADKSQWWDAMASCQDDDDDYLNHLLFSETCLQEFYFGSLNGATPIFPPRAACSRIYSAVEISILQR